MEGTGSESLDEEILFLKQVEVFSSLSAEELRIVLDRGRMETHARGSVIFDIGDPADAVYVVKKGVVEICRRRGEGDEMSVVAYLGEGDPIGETAIITGSSRGSMGRVPERAEILRIDKASFMDLLGHIPGLLLTLLRIFAKRLERGFREERAAARHRHLSGKLEYFDLPTVIQALANSSRTGTLIIKDKSGRVFAALYFQAGRMLYAKLGRLKGKEAFYQLFQSPMQDAFSFKGGPPPREFADDAEISVPTMALLLESTRRQDELQTLKARYPDPHRVFLPQSGVLTWDEQETHALAEEIWVRLQRGETIEEMVNRVPACEHSIYKLFYAMDVRGLLI